MTGCCQQKPNLGLTKCPDLVDHYNSRGPLIRVGILNFLSQKWAINR